MISEKLCYIAGFFAEALTVWLYLEYLFDRKQSNLVISFSFILGYLLLTYISELDNTTLNAVACSIVNFLLIILNYQCKIKNAFMHTAFLCFIMTGSEIIVALMISIFGFEFTSYTYNFYVLLTLTILSRMLYFVFSIIGSHVLSQHKYINKASHSSILFYILPTLSAIIAVFTVYFGMAIGVTVETGMMMFVTTLTLLTANIIFLALYNYTLRMNEEYLTLQLSIQKEQADAAYYEALQEQFENQQILVHDIKKHLATIEELARKNEAREIQHYVSDLNMSFIPSRQVRLCTDPILNFILLRFSDECMEHSVTFHCDVREKISGFMDATSTTTLYGNLLSNALESATISENKHVSLSVTWNDVKSAIVISVVNTCDTIPLSDGHGHFYTRKKDRMIHGVGLRSIERVLKRFQGISTMYYDADSRLFHHVIQIPVSQ